MQYDQKNSGVYLIVNLQNGKVYVGSSSNITSRWKDHLKVLRGNRHHSIHLQRAVNKYGFENFVFTVAELASENLIELEQKWIDVTQSSNRKYGYNIRPTADMSTLSEESKQKIRKKLLGHTVSDFTRERISQSRKNIPMPESGKQKLREHWNNGKVPVDVLEKMKKGRTGHKNTPEHNEILRKANTGSKRSAKTIERLKIAWVLRKQKKLLALDKNHAEVRS